MMGYGDSGGWMWGYGWLMMLGVLVLIGLAVWAVLPGVSRAPDAIGRNRTRQILDEQYAAGEMNTDEYTERQRTLGL